MRLAEFMRDQITENVEMWTPPRSLEGWANAFDRMLRLDGPKGEGIPADMIEKVIWWVVRDDFERKNVLSAAKLRKRFASLWAKAKPEDYSPEIEAHKKQLVKDGYDSNETTEEAVNNLTPQEKAMLGHVEF